MSAENFAVARRWFEEVWNQRRDQTIDELLTPHSVCHTDEGPIVGKEEFRARMYVPLLSAFPDLRVEVEGVTGQGDDVVVRWSAAGTHSGDGLGFAPTGKGVILRGITWMRVR